MLNQIKSGLIVSCQALEDEPLHGSEIMKKMANAAQIGGAIAIRANGIDDIRAIKDYVNLPVIGIIKHEYKESNVYISPTMSEVDCLVEIGVELIALDATNRIRPFGLTLDTFFAQVKEKYPTQKWMADCSTLEECKNAEKIGFDCVGTTLFGYTENTAGNKLYDNDFSFLKKVVRHVTIPVIAEGNVLTPEMAYSALKHGAHSVVVGGAITRPQQITHRFASMIKTI